MPQKILGIDLGTWSVRPSSWSRASGATASRPCGKSRSSPETRSPAASDSSRQPPPRRQPRPPRRRHRRRLPRREDDPPASSPCPTPTRRRSSSPSKVSSADELPFDIKDAVSGHEDPGEGEGELGLALRRGSLSTTSGRFWTPSRAPASTPSSCRSTSCSCSTSTPTSSRATPPRLTRPAAPSIEALHLRRALSGRTAGCAPHRGRRPRAHAGLRLRSRAASPTSASSAQAAPT